MRADFESIAALGLDHVRIFPLWPLLQPNRSLIRPASLADVCREVDAAAEFGLDVSVDGLQGHPSSSDYQPSFVTSWHRRNIYTDPRVAAAKAQLITALAAELTTPAEMRERSATLLAAARKAWPARMHQPGFDDNTCFVDSCPVTPWHAANLGDAATVRS